MGFGRKHSDWDAMVEALKKMQGERDALRLELEETKERLKTIGDHHARMMALPCQKCEASKKRAERLEGALVLAAIPLEALHLTEMDGKALSPEMKSGIKEAVKAIREALTQEAGEGKEKEGV